MLQYHKTIDGSPSVTLEAIHQHYQKWEGMSQNDSEVGEHTDDLEHNSS